MTSEERAVIEAAEAWVGDPGACGGLLERAIEALKASRIKWDQSGLFEPSLDEIRTIVRYHGINCPCACCKRLESEAVKKTA